MGRKMAVFSMAIVLVFAMVTMASAAANVTSNSQKGSLLVFPKVIALDMSADTVNTYFFIGNDNSVPTWVKCYWMDNNQTSYDFMFLLTSNQPVVFDALTGYNEFFEIPPFAGIGTLVCFAQSDDDRVPRDFDHLYGTALIRQGTTAWIYYDAFSFAARGASYFTAYDASGTPVAASSPEAVWGSLNLTGDTGYDTCPLYLVANFIPENSTLAPAKPDLTLWPCKQDLRQDRIPTCTKAKFDIWNENEVKFTGAYQCFKCFFEGFLTDIGVTTAGTRGAFMYNRGPGYGGDKFSQGVLQTDVARMRVQGVYSSVCITTQNAQGTAVAKTKTGGKSCPNINADGTKSTSFTTAWGRANDITPLLGVLLYATANDTVPMIGLNPKAGHTMHGAGQTVNAANPANAQNAGFIKFDLGGGVVEKPAQ